MPLTNYLQYFHQEEIGLCLPVAYTVSFFHSDSTLPYWDMAHFQVFTFIVSTTKLDKLA